MNQEAPVGTTLAIMERAMKVQSAIQARIHASLKQEYKILARIIADFTSPDYPYETDAGEGIKAEDFDDRIDVIPVSDPNASTMAQRIMQYQAALQLAQQAPNMYDLPLLHRQMMELIGIPNADKVVPIANEVPPKDPVTENQAMMTQEPVKVYEYQDHEAHMRVHMALKNDPQMAQEVQNSPAGQAIGTELPPMGQPIPEDIEKRLSSLVADAADQMMGKKQQQAAAQQAAQQQQDPIIQMRQQELMIRQQEQQRKAQADQAKQMLEQQKLALLEEKLETDQQLDVAELSLKEQELMIKAQSEKAKLDASQELEGIKLGREIAKDGDSE